MRIRFDDREMIVADEVLGRTLQLADKASKFSSPVLVSGESGTGKELIARYIHQKSDRSKKHFVSINCAAIPDGLLESELFGYERGAFTGANARHIGRFERASGGTLLLDEISEMPLALQAKLLRVLQEREVERLGGNQPIRIDTRVIATTNRRLEPLIHAGKFREDLFFRLNVIRIQCFPLRGRPEAIRSMAQEFLAQLAAEQQTAQPTVSESAWNRLLEYSWPGNIRELKNVLERAMWMSSGSRLDDADLEFTNHVVCDGDSSNGDTLDEIERKHILAVLKKHHGNRTHAARTLGVSVRTLRNKLKRYHTLDNG